jgi:hypothetical protein
LTQLAISAFAAAIGYGVFFFSDHSRSEPKIQLIAKYELQYLYIAPIIFSLLVRHLNFYPLIYKSRVFNINSKNLRANLYVYRALKGDGEKGYQGTAVVLDEEGHVGEYNRANRSLTHFTENNGAFLASFLLAGFVFPFETLVATAIFAFGRFIHQVGYTIGFGSHGPGFGLSLFSSLLVEGLCSVVVLKSFGLI